MSQGSDLREGGGEGYDFGFLWDVQQWAFADIDKPCGGDDPQGAALTLTGAAPVVGSCTNSPTAREPPRHHDPKGAALTGAPVVGSCTNSPTAREPPPPPASSPMVCKKRGRGEAAVASSSKLVEGKSGVGESDHEIHIWTERERRKKMRNMFSTLHALLPQLTPKADKSTIVDEAVNYIKTLQQKLKDLENQKQERIQRSNAAVITIDEPSSTSIHLQQQQQQPVQVQVLRNSPASSETTAPVLRTREAFMADQVAKNWPVTINNNTSSTPAAVSVARFSQSFHTWSSPNVVLSVIGEDAHISICAPRKPGLFSTVLCVMEKHKLEVVSASVSSDDHLRSMIMIHARASGHRDQFPETILMMEEIYKLAVSEMIIRLSSYSG
ncbi:hypothetical protein Cni_G24303 [Canna indica]|uniref:BHLH domain-containing protein n=1 Tax=Canna indica TaxID=4628 RepID=A0AAQ3KUR9_9LILI|nr:hypothetical protein Cni_G24303 [Canna indica]